MTVRPLLRTTVAGLTLGGVTLAGAPAAMAAPGDNGDVKIHAVGTPFNDPRNEPKVCQFYLAAFNFDTLQQVTWSIAPQPLKPDGANRNGQITLATGTGQTMPIASLPNGQYKLTWTFVGQTGAAKSKVFKVDCPQGGNGQPNGPVGAGAGGEATIAADSSFFGVGATLTASLAGVAGLILVRRSRRRNDGAS